MSAYRWNVALHRARVGVRTTNASIVPSKPDDADGEETGLEEMELDDAELRAMVLPELDTDDPELLLQEAHGYTDLIDGEWLERAAEIGELEEDGAYGEVGLTIELNGPDTGEDLAQVVDLDVGSLLTSLPGEGGDLDLDLDLTSDQTLGDGAFALGALGDVSLPGGEGSQGERADDEIGDDDRFPVFEDSSIVAPRRPPLDDGAEDLVLDDDDAF